MKEKGIVIHRNISPYYSKFSRVPATADGVLTSQGQFIEYSAVENVTSSEYSLGNLIAIGAANGLSYVSMSLNSDMNFVDDFARSYNTTITDVSQDKE